MEICLRDAHEPDFVGIDACFSAAGSHWRSTDAAHVGQQRGLRVAEVESRLAGFCLFDLAFESCNLLFIYTLESFRQRGVAIALLGDLKTTAANAAAMSVALEVRQSNAVAIALYRREGFSVDGRRPGYYPALQKDGSREDAVLMSYRLPGE